MREDTLTYHVSAGSRGDTFVITLEGPLTLNTMQRFEKELIAMRPKALILDLSGVPYMDSAGLGVLMNFYVAAQHHQRVLMLTGVSRRVDALLELTKVKPLLACFESVSAAEASLQG